jgi:hypothetical protein
VCQPARPVVRGHVLRCETLSGWVIWAVQTFLRFDLAWRNRLQLEPRDLEVLRDLPRGAGIILAANHADETDFKACLEVSRRSGRRFQRLEAFSVERGGPNNQPSGCPANWTAYGGFLLRYYSIP